MSWRLCSSICCFSVTTVPVGWAAWPFCNTVKDRIMYQNCVNTHSLFTIILPKLNSLMLDWCNFMYLWCSGGVLQQPLFFPQTTGNNSSNFHRLLQIFALQMLFDPAQVMLVEHIVLLEEAAVLLVYFSQKVVEHQCSVRLLIGSIGP